MLVYKMNVMEEFKKAGWTNYNLQTKHNRFGEAQIGSSQIKYLKDGKVPGTSTIDAICKILDVQPGDLIEYIPDDRYIALKKSGYFDEKGIPTPPLEENSDGK